ncbi:transcriptional regulator, RpiR family [Xaviernesmea oryzae]|uniref:Transcriptional regulator, RpiR family n=1 Tax=Xaviernesmea oryzae TaxID=464029 RepID=A0A1X7DXU1_9HYPH|nr:MurR/RpiR family transcriptional regulator [Xaviernesmea oryzae]SMF23521.1 transcriptional regulator, RpiR family [Xaviernesmea oryzae]
MQLAERVQTVAETLTPAERKLVKEIISKPRDVALGTALELARKMGVHQATAGRLARKLGFETYSDFRDAIRDEFIVKTDPALRVRKTLEISRGQSILDLLIQQEVEALSRLTAYIDESRLNDAAKTISECRRIFIFARGNAETLAVLMDRRLRRMAFETVVISGDSRDIAEQILTMGRQDALILFAFRRQPDAYIPLMEHVRKVGARSIVISGAVGPSLSPQGDHLLSAPRAGKTDAFQTLTVPMAICNGLILSIAQFDEKRSLIQLETLGELIASFDRR